jgi:hypothetical protein
VIVRRLLVVATLGALAVAPGCAKKAPMSAEDARAFTAQALARIGYSNALVDGNPSRAFYKSPDPRYSSDTPIEVWRTKAALPDGEVELYVARRGDSAVFVRDSRVGGERLLSDSQFRALARFRMNPADSRRREDQRDVGAAAVALVVIIAAALFGTVLTGAADRRQRLHSSRTR